MTVGSLFAGIGGFDLGFDCAGFTTVWQVEKDKWCQKVLAKHFPMAKRFGDIRETGKHNLSPVDVICGGFPCQPFSSAGKQGGTEDDRYLWPEMLRVISELKPSWVVAENVLGLVTGKMEAVFQQVLSDLEGEGYEVQAFIIPACGVDAPHRRYRVWIVAHATGKRCRETGQYGKRPEERLACTGAASSNMGNTNIKRLEARERGAGSGAALREPTGPGGNVADAQRKQLQQRGISGVFHGETGETGEIEAGEEKRERRRNTACDSCTDVSDTASREAFTSRFSWESTSFHEWEAEPAIRRTLDGLSAGMDRYRKDRLRGLGNAIVPQIAELFGHIIMEVEQAKLRRAA